MGLGGGDVLLDDGGGCGNDEVVDKALDLVSCSICLDAVTDHGDRSWAKLQCGHRFHLDCIGSAFNVKGAMQCPNCRKIEKGQWLFATGCRSLPEFSLDDLTHEDLYDLGYSEMSFGVHWCPFGGLAARLPSAFDEADFSSTAYNEYLGQHGIITEPTAISSANHPCPYIAFFRPVHPSSSTSSGSISDASNFNNHWNGASRPNEISYAFPEMDVRYHNWDHQSTPFSTNRLGGAEQSSIQSASQRARTATDIPRPGSFVQPFNVGHSSANRAGSSVATSMVPPYPGSVARARHRVQALQAYYQQLGTTPTLRTPTVSSSRRSSSHRNVAQVGVAASSSDQTNGFYYFPSSSSGRNPQEAENPMSNHYHSRERENLPSFPSTQIERDAGWGSMHHLGGGSEAGIRAPHSFRQRHGAERMPWQNRS